MKTPTKNDTSFSKQRDKSLVKRSMRGLTRSKSPMMPKPSTSMAGDFKAHTQMYMKSKQMRMSVNLASMNKGPQFKGELKNQNKSVLGLRTSKQRGGLKPIEDTSVRQSQRTNDFWNLSKDSVNQLDLKTRIYSKPEQDMLMNGGK